MRAAKSYDSSNKNLNDSKTLKESGNTLFNNGQYDDAIQCYVKAIELNPEYLDAWNNLGYVLKKVGRIDEAKQCDLKVKELKHKLNNADELRRKYEDGLITYQQYHPELSSQGIQTSPTPSVKPKQSNENIQWALIGAIPLGLMGVFISGSYSFSNTAELLGGLCGGVFMWFIIFYLGLQFIFNRPKE